MSIPREHRLRKHSEFELVYRSGRRHFSPVLTVFYLFRKQEQEPDSRSGSATQSGEQARIGITVGRALGKATVRNRIKRRVRENLGRIKRPVDVVINPKKVVQEIEFQKLCAEVAKAFAVIEEKVEIPEQARGQSAECIHRTSVSARKN